MLVVRRGGNALLDVLSDEEVHALAAEAGRRPPARSGAPATTVQAGLLGELPPGGRERLFSLLDDAGRKLEQRPAGRLP